MSEWSQREAVRHRRSEAEVADREPGRSSQSIEPRLRTFSLRLKLTGLGTTFPAEIEPRRAVRDKQLPLEHISAEDVLKFRTAEIARGLSNNRRTWR